MLLNTPPCSTVSLSFSIAPRELKDENGQAYVYVEVRPLIDGQVLTDAYEFDVLTMLALEATPSTFHPFTCSCGSAGCVGIFEEVALSSKVETPELQWVFPEKPFRKTLNPALFKKEAPLVLSFSRAAYLEALENLRRALLDVEAAQAVPVQLFAFGEPDLSRTVQQSFDSYHTYVHQQLGADQARNALFGELSPKSIRILLTGGSRYRLDVVCLANLLVEGEETRIGEENPLFLSDTVVPLLKQGNAAILEALMALPWEEVLPYIYWDYDATADLVEPPWPPPTPASWADVALEVVG
jgi:hypothetical protein